jgi:hypothetical protein
MVNRKTVPNNIFIVKIHKDSVECNCSCGNTETFLFKNIKKIPKHCSLCQKTKDEAVKEKSENPRTKFIKEYATWVNMNQGCYNKKHIKYGDFGIKGITVCEEWKRTEGFLKFFKDMGEKPTPTRLYSLVRIDSKKNFEPSNCKWGRNRFSC